MRLRSDRDRKLADRRYDRLTPKPKLLTNDTVMLGIQLRVGRLRLDRRACL